LPKSFSAHLNYTEVCLFVRLAYTGFTWRDQLFKIRFLQRY